MTLREIERIIENNQLDILSGPCFEHPSDDLDYRELYNNLMTKYLWTIEKISAYLDSAKVDYQQKQHHIAALERKTLALINLNQELMHQCNMDELTAVHSRSYMLGRIKNEIQRSLEEENNFVLAMIDLDNFKFINDRFGHLEGDRVLRLVGKTLNDKVRKTDIVGRYGGDEFFILMPDTQEKEAERILNRLCKAITDNTAKHLGKHYKVTVSSGYCVSDDHRCADFSELINLADRGLLRAKSLGKNRIVQQHNSSMAV